MSLNKSSGRWASAFVTGWMIGLSATAVYAQVGGGQVSSPGSTGTQSFETKEGATGLNLIVNPFYRREKYDSYNVSVLTRLANDPFLTDISTNSFRLTTKGISVGADYVTPGGLLLGMLVTYQDGSAKFEAPSDQERSAVIALSNRADLGLTTGFDDEDLSEYNQSFILGDPLKRTYESFGGTAAIGYVLEDFTVIGTAGISHRSYKSKRREFWNTNIYSVNEGKYDSWVYDFEVGISKTITFSSVTITPVASIGYHRENADSYTEDRATVYFGNEFFGASDVGLNEQLFPSSRFDVADFNDVAFNASDVNTRRNFSDDKIISIPLTLGMTVGYPVSDAIAISFGASYTHDFSDQQRTLYSQSVSPQLFPGSTNRDYLYQERQHNRNMVSLQGGLTYALTDTISASLDYRHDFGMGDSDRGDADFVQFLARFAF